MLWWRYCKRPKEKIKKKLLRFATLELTFDNNKPKKWVRDQFNAEIADLRQARQTAQERRDNFMDDEIDAGILRQDMSRVKMLEQIKRYEEKKTSFSTLKRVLQKPQRKSTQIEVPGTADWEAVTEEEDVTAALRQEFMRHFTQASKTPFITQNLDKITREILHTYHPSEFMALEWTFVNQIDTPTPVPYEVKGSELIDGFRKWKEGTSTSTSRSSLSLYKVLLQKKSDDEERDYQVDFSEIFADILNISVRY